MAPNTVITEKTTAKIYFQLFDGGTAVNLTGMTVALLLTDRLGNVIASPTVTVETAASGKVSYTPASTATLVAANSPYRARFKVTDGAGAIKYFPQGLRDEWEITEE